MPYLTEFNERRILENLYSEINENITDKDIYHKSLPFLNRLELSKLLHFKKFCKGDVPVDTVYKKAEKIDRKKFIYEGNLPSYHKTEECENLNSNFTNIELPEHVQDWEFSKVEEFRNWFKKVSREDIEDDEIVRKIQERWNIVCSLNRVNYKNSGSIYKENLDIENIENRINSLLRAQNNYYLQNKSYLMKYTQRTYLAFKKMVIVDNDTGLNDDDLKEKIKLYHDMFKVPVTYYLREYFKIKFSKDVQFDKKLLDSLKFQPCKSCYKEDIESDYNKLNGISSEPTQLDKFLKERNAKRLCRKPSELLANRNQNDQNYLEFYYFCKIISRGDIIELKGINYREYIIEYIHDDVIHYEKANFKSDTVFNDSEEVHLRLYDGYLVYTRFHANNHRDVSREIFDYTYSLVTNLY